MRALLFGLLLLAAPAIAQPVPPISSFEVTIDRRIAAPPAAVYDRIIHIEGWWSASHSYSGNAANFHLEAVAGGCWCENWPAGSVAHGRVLAAIPGQLLRISGGLGPLQERPVAAVLTFALTPVDNGAATALAVRYRVAGPVADLGGPVTAVLGQQIEQLVAGFR